MEVDPPGLLIILFKNRLDFFIFGLCYRRELGLKLGYDFAIVLNFGGAKAWMGVIMRDFVVEVEERFDLILLLQQAELDK